MRATRWARALALLAVLALLGAACGGDDGGGGGNEGGTITIDGAPANDHGSEDVSGRSSMEFELDDFYFSPTVLEGEAGQTVTLNATNEGEATHTLTADGVDAELAPGAGTSVHLTFPESGVLVFECRFHADQGMRGALSVGPLTGGETSPTSDTSPPADDGGGYDY